MGSSHSREREAIEDKSEIISHPAFLGWQAMDPNVAIPDRIVPMKTKKKSHVFVLHGAFNGLRSVVAKLCDPESARIESVMYEQVLPHLGVASPRLVGCSQKDADSSWLFIEYIGDAHCMLTDPAHRAAMIDWLAALHGYVVSPTTAEQLPDTGHLLHVQRLEHSFELIERGRANPALTADDQKLLTSLVGHLETIRTLTPDIIEVCGRAPASVTHGDLGAKHLRVREHDGGVDFLTFDWEHCGVGYRGTDLARVSNEWTASDFDRYCEASRPLWPEASPSGLKSIIQVGQLMQLTTFVYWATGWLRAPEGGMKRMTKYEQLLAPALAEQGWRR